MNARIFSLIVLSLLILIFLHREKVSHRSRVHHSSDKLLIPYNKLTNNGYTTGQYENHPRTQLTLFQYLTYKKINSYVFVHYNVYKVQIIFVDFGYSSQILFSFLNIVTNVHQVRAVQKIGFSLPDQSIYGMNFNLFKNNFNLTVRQYVDKSQKQTYTTFNLLLTNQKHSIQANLVHTMRNQQCITLTRAYNSLSHKCYGGFGNGKVKIQNIDKNGQKNGFGVYHLNDNFTRSVFQFIRSPGSHFKLTSAMGTGFDKNQYNANNHEISNERWIGINFGQLHNESQNFIFWSGQIIHVKDLQYIIDEDLLKKQKVITFKANNPALELNFTTSFRNKRNKDYLLLKVDIIKVEGFWQGWIFAEGRNNSFPTIAGVVQICDSLL